jgi:glyoxylase-like metal-dependent hydrolase (beta-lactamase superfamily II)/GNAT superfamily N-acetyltransferase
MIEINVFQTKEAFSEGEFIDRNPNISYLLTSNGNNKESILIDANLDPKKLDHKLKENYSNLRSIFLTHLHHDHIKNLKSIINIFPLVEIHVNSHSSKAVKNFGLKNVQFLKDRKSFFLKDLELVPIFTPGHTYDSVCLWVPKYKMLFTGDTLLGGGVGCCDYKNGGNRNIFYSTLKTLLQNLSPETIIYPGHYSEHYQFPPPYILSGELTSNTYLVNVLKGKRGRFDYALKEFSLEFETNNHFLLSESDVNIIYELEKQTWIPELRASKKTILKRLRLGHKMLALRNNGNLSGMIAWRYDDFSLKNGFEKFPQDFNKFSNQKSLLKSEAESAFIYNLGVKPSARKQGVGSALLQWAFEKIRSDGIKHVFVDSRIPSYQGSDHNEFEKFLPANEVANAISTYFSKGFFSEKEGLSVDPILNFYTTSGFRPWLIKKEFIQDKSSGNIRIICYTNLEHDETPMTPLDSS